MYCETCKTKTHDTKDCWGLGTVAIDSNNEPYYLKIGMDIARREGINNIPWNCNRYNYKPKFFGA